jgi:hypothetical protein
MSVYVVKNWDARVARAYADETLAHDIAGFLATGLGLVAKVDMYEFCEQGWDEELVHLVENEWEIYDYNPEKPVHFKDGVWGYVEDML